MNQTSAFPYFYVRGTHKKAEGKKKKVIFNILPFLPFCSGHQSKLMRSSFLSFKVKVMKTFLKRFKSFYASSVFDLEYGREVDRRKRYLVKSSTIVTTR